MPVVPIRALYVVLLLLLFCLPGFAQKKPLDIAAHKNWQQAWHAVLSMDEQYIAGQLSDSIVLLYSLTTGFVDTIKIPTWRNHLLFDFDPNSRQLVFKSLGLRPKPVVLPGSKVAVDVWSWQDSVFQSAQLYRLEAPDSFIVINRCALEHKTMISPDTVAFDRQLLKPAATDAMLLNSPFAIKLTRPQKEYNWYTAEKISLHAPASVQDQGVLYRPEDFDSARKYPLIICLTNDSQLSVGENYNTGLYAPVLSNGTFPIPYFVSNGYVVLTLPSTIQTGRPGPAMFDRVIRAVITLRGYNWVDTAHLGIQGEGTAAYFVNYIITQTPLFKAAETSAGQTDLISHYGAVDGKGIPMRSFYDDPQGFFGKTLWEDSSAYIHQSPVIYADAIVTPLLMMHNKEDKKIPFSQGLEFFTDMRRLGNRCWMLQYNGEGHWLSKEEDQIDFTRRLYQFFDHYLKEKGAPLWMTRGVPAKRKGMEDSFAIDTVIKTPSVGGLLNEESYRKRFGNLPRDLDVFNLLSR